MAADQCRLDSTVNCVVISSSTQPNWWDHDHLHAAAAAAGAGSHLSASSWPWQRQQQQQQQQKPNPNSNSSCDEDVSISSTSFTNASNHSSLSVDSSRRLVDQRSASSNDDLNNIGEQVSDNQIWSHVLLSAGNNGLNGSMTHDVGENFLDALSSKNLTNTAMYDPACDYLKKLDNASSNWEFTNSSTTAATMHASNLNNFERQININGSFSNENLSNLVSTWSIAPPEPQLVSSPFFNNLPHQVSCYGAHNNLMKVESAAQLAGANIHGRPFSSENGSNIDYQIGLNNAMAADNNYYGSGNGLVMPDSYSSSNSARSFTDVISFNSRLGKPLIDHVHHAQKPSNFKSSINLSDNTCKKQGLQTSSPVKMSGRGQGTANESAGKKKRTEDSSTSSETVLKKPKQETSAANSSSSSVKMQAPKVKVADKITALQQIVSPFGKTDTASVLYEAIQYIKFLQDQIHVLSSSPYLKTNTHKDSWGKLDQIRGDHQVKMDLKSRGLCLVPTSCTPQVYRENTGSDYWTPAYRGCLYR
ncbi:PREDICTED: transcription factor bHLH111 isoform X4 [Fragaria vesca subsp. vesca]|uniref:transcription factor bHLH111 isoform X4 n=1 Tax=Fragaria vesca subsp. vesca TaxID=101020 RepID=UPI0002C32A1A|nr:PREDICTED: transcription factor bHLH111 isoform X4 [Fragaria vesca subsp. vesca]